ARAGRRGGQRPGRVVRAVVGAPGRGARRLHAPRDDPGKSRAAPRGRPSVGARHVRARRRPPGRHHVPAAVPRRRARRRDPGVEMAEDPKKLEAARKAAIRSTELRRLQKEAQASLAAVEGEVAAQRAKLEAVRAQGGATRQLATATKALDAAERRLTAALNLRCDLVLDLERHRKRLADVLEALRDPAATLAGDVPVLMLPARVETRFVGDELRVRVFPDTAHVDQLERVPTAEEVEAAHAYWRERWTATTEEAARDVWARHTAGRPVNRFAYLVERTTPLNPDRLGTGAAELP